jgi:hypothetical protein
MIAGHTRHGDLDLMESAGIPAAETERLTIGGRAKGLYTTHPSSPLSGLSLSEAMATLTEAMSRLHTLQVPLFEPLEASRSFELELDMQAPDLGGPELLAAESAVPDSIPLDPLTLVGDPDYFNTLRSIPHLPDYIKAPDGLQRFYRGGPA